MILEEPAAVEEEESAVVFGKDASCVKCMAREKILRASVDDLCG